MKADLTWLDDPEVFRVNQMAAHSDHQYYADYREWRREESSLVQPLDGCWSFRYSVNAQERPKEFYREDAAAEGFGTIQVPGHIELAGYDQIHYINTMYPWEGHIYRRPAYAADGKPAKGSFRQAQYNPVGSYRLEFDLKESMVGKRISICFEGVEQAMYVWLNGEFIGYAEDSFTPSEFDLTSYIREKGNLLAVEVHKRSTAAYLEDQDFFRFFGIFRSVKLYARPKIHVEDMWLRPELAADLTTGSLAGQFCLSMAENAGAGSVRVRLLDARDNQIFEKTYAAAEEIALDKTELTDIRPWSYDTPYLYTLVAEVKDEHGKLLETASCEIGFRRLELVEQVIRFNGKRLKICGVNRHEWSAKTGRCITEQEMQQDIRTLLDCNINAVRTCHYPDQIAWYRMCDRAGIYVMAETNLESHGSWQKMGAVEPSWNVPGDSPRWLAAVLDRAKSNFELLKNHPSILFWSLGNESYAGEDLVAMNRYFKEKQDGRLIHYEGVVHNRALEDVISDVESRMYAKPAEIEAYLSDHPRKPFLLCEYMHCMGNSLGGMDSYMKLFDQYEMYQGGFIWDFIDQALLVRDEVTGEEVLRYGGDFDDRPSDYDFSGNGILFADRTEKPAVQEVRYYYEKYR